MVANLIIFFITLSLGQHLKVIFIEEIECFFSENKGTYIHTFDNQNYMIDSTIKVLEREMDPGNFFRISRKFIIPLRQLRKLYFIVTRV